MKSITAIPKVLILFALITACPKAAEIEPAAQATGAAGETVIQTEETVFTPRYTDIHLYQGMFYYGQPDSILELKKINGESFMIFYSVSGNSVSETTRIKIDKFETGIGPYRERKIACKINGTDYRLFLFSTSLKNLRYTIQKLKEDYNPGALMKPGKEFITEYPPDIKFTNGSLKATACLNCQDMLSMMGEYKVVYQHSYTKLDDSEYKLDEVTIENVPDPAPAIKVFRGYHQKISFELYTDNSGFRGTDDPGMGKQLIHWAYRSDDMIIVPISADGPAEYTRYADMILKDDTLYLQDAMVRSSTRYDFYILKKTF